MNDDPNGNAPEPAGPQAAETADLASLPFPIAYPLAHARDCALAPRDRLDNAIFAAYQAMRLTALLLLADYLACDVTSRRLAAPIRGLRMPHWGEWTLLADQLAKLWRGDFPDEPITGPSHFTALVDGWMDVNRGGAPKRGDDPWRALLEGLPGTQGRARSANDAVQKLRNNRAHRMATRIADQSDDERLLGRILPVVERSAACLFPAGSLVLVRSVEKTDQGLRVLRLHGPHADFLFEPEPLPSEWASAFEATGVAALVGDIGVPIYPLFVPGDEEPDACRVGSGGLVEPVSLVDGLNEKRVVLLGVRSHGESQKHLAPLLEALERKRVGLGQDRQGTSRRTLAGWSRATARETVAALRGRKYFPECYVKRRRVDEPASACLERAGRALLVLGEAGAGKSSLLARLADRLSAEESDDDPTDKARPSKKNEHAALEHYLAAKGGGDVILFLSGHAAFAGDAEKGGAALLCDAVLERAGVRAGEFRNLAELMARLAETANDDTQRDRRVWLLLDALNEADRFTDLLKALDAFLPDVEKYPWLRVVVSMRSGAYHALAVRRLTSAAHGGSVLSNERFLHTFHDGRLDRVLPYLELPPFDEADEGRQAYEKRQTALPDRSSAIPYERLTPSLRTLLLSPLHLHVFHETFRGDRDVPTTIDEGLLLDAYLDQLSSDLPALRGMLVHVGRLMYDRRAPMLPLEVADEWLKGWQEGRDSAELVVKLNPIEELVAASVLMRPSEQGIGTDRRLVGYQFSHQKLCERVLLRELLRQIAPRHLPTGEELLAWAKHAAGPELGEHDDFGELIGALEVMAARLAGAGEGVVLAALLDLEDDPARTRILGSALSRPSGEHDAQLADVLKTLVATAIDDPRRRSRFLATAERAHDWMASCGFGRASEALARARLSILRRRVDINGGRDPQLLSDLAACSSIVGSAAVAAGELGEARTFLEESLRASRRAVARVGRVSWSVARLIIRGGFYAIWYFFWPLRTWTDWQRQLAIAGTTFHAHVLEWVGWFLAIGGRSAAARLVLSRQVDVLRQLTVADPSRSELRSALAGALESLSRFAVAEGRRGEARVLFEEARRVRGYMSRQGDSGSLPIHVPRTLIVRPEHPAVLLRQNWQAITGAATLESASSAMGNVSAAMWHRNLSSLVSMIYLPDRLRDELAKSLLGVGELALAEHRLPDAGQCFREALELARRVGKRQPDRAEFRATLARCFDHLADLAMVEGGSDAARRYRLQSVQELRRVVDTEPRELDWRRDLSTALCRLGCVAADADEARALQEESRQVTSGLAYTHISRSGSNSG